MLAIVSSVVPMGLNDLYWSRILYPAMNHRAIFRGSYVTIHALKLAPMRLRLHYRPECHVVTGQSPEDMGSQAEPGNQEKKLVPPHFLFLFRSAALMQQSFRQNFDVTPYVRGFPRFPYAQPLSPEATQLRCLQITRPPVSTPELTL